MISVIAGLLGCAAIIGLPQARADDLDLIPQAVLDPAGGDSSGTGLPGQAAGPEARSTTTTTTTPAGPTGPAGPAESAPPPPGDPAAGRRGRLFLEWLPQFTQWRSSWLPAPAAHQPALGHRLALDGRTQWDLGETLSLTLSDRLSMTQDDQRPAFNRDTLHNDLRELFVTWRGNLGTGNLGTGNLDHPDADAATAAPGIFLQAGRINLRNGVALGFNPTDFFKTRSVVSRTTEDPSVQRDNRLGTLMLRGEVVGDSGSLGVAVAPPVGEQHRRWWSDARGYGLELGRTNRLDRWLLKANWTLAEDLTPEVLVYREGGSTRAGLGLTHGLGERLVIYGEWAGGFGQDLANRSLNEARRTGVLPASARSARPVATGERFLSQLALGFSWTGDHKDTTTVEYHFNQAGLDGDDWRRWRQAGRANPLAAAQLWLIRAQARELLEPLTRHRLFLRSHWQDALADGFDLTGLADVNLADGSLFTQVQAEYRINHTLTAGLTAGSGIGRRDSEYGSLPRVASLLGTLRWDF